MLTFSTILQGSEATEKNAIGFANYFDFSEDEIEETPFIHCRFFTALNGISIYYNYGADYYFFTADHLNN
jgi:hypothetical protein